MPATAGRPSRPAAGVAAALAVEGGDLALGGGLLALVRPALDLLEPGGVLAVLAAARSVAEDLPAWCRFARHEYLDSEPMPDGRTRHFVKRGASSVPRGEHEHGFALPRHEGRIFTSDLAAA